MYSKPPPWVYLLRYAKPSPQEFLAHHGILGQKWGVRNGPPYPLGVSNHSASEKKAGWGKSLDKDSKSVDNKKRTNVDDFKRLSQKESIREAVKKVNPSGSNTNCRACAIAAILRMQGMDVEALGTVQGGYVFEAVNDCFKGGDTIAMHSPNKKRVTNYILKHYGEGSSGVLGATFVFGQGIRGGHAISWAVKDGVVSFFDGQNNYPDCSWLLDIIYGKAEAEIARLDNLEINADGIKNYIKNC